MAKRQRVFTVVRRMDFIVASGVTADDGEMACLDTATAGHVRPGVASTTLRPIGYFTKAITGDGVKKTTIELFNDVILHRWANDTVTAVAATDIGDPCYVKDARTVTATSAGNSVAGRVWGVGTGYVEVEMNGFAAG